MTRAQWTEDDDGYIHSPDGKGCFDQDSAVALLNELQVERDALRKALQLLSKVPSSEHVAEYVRGIARAALRKSKGE